MDGQYTIENRLKNEACCEATFLRVLSRTGRTGELVALREVEIREPSEAAQGQEEVACATPDLERREVGHGLGT